MGIGAALLQMRPAVRAWRRTFTWANRSRRAAGCPTISGSRATAQSAMNPIPGQAPRVIEEQRMKIEIEYCVM